MISEDVKVLVIQHHGQRPLCKVLININNHQDGRVQHE